jgi:MSHA biogenesis protein MshQ
MSAAINLVVLYDAMDVPIAEYSGSPVTLSTTETLHQFTLDVTPGSYDLSAVYIYMGYEFTGTYPDEETVTIYALRGYTDADAAPSSDPGDLTGMTLRKAITIDHTYVDADLTDFPLFVKITADADLGAACRSDGRDIRFSVNGSTAIPHERVSWSISGGDATGVFFVKVPTVNGSSNTTLYIYYGDPTADTDTSMPATVFSGFKCVYHCEQTSGTIADALFANALTPDTLSNITGISGNGYSVAGTGGAYRLSDTDHDIGTGDVTLEAWVKFTNGTQPDTFSGDGIGAIVGKGFIGSTAGGGGIFIRADVPWAQLRDSTPTLAEVTGSGTIGDDAWHHLAVTVDRDNSSGMVLYVDGVADATGDPTSISSDDLTSSNRFAVGTRYDASDSIFFKYNGKFDEIRQSAVARSAAWIKFTYRNLHESDNEISLGSEEAVGGGGGGPGGQTGVNASFFLQMCGVP